MRSPPFLRRAYAVLARLSAGYPPLPDTFRCITHPFAARRQGCPRAAARLACVKHAASVQSEPGSNSSVDLSYYFQSKTHSNAHPEGWTRAIRPRPNSPHIASCEHQLHESPRQQPKDHHRRHPPAPTPIDCELLRNRLSARAPSGVVLHRREGIATSEQRRRGIVARLSASRNPSSCHARRRRFPARDPERASSSAGFGYFHLLWIHSQSAGDSRIVASRCRA